MAQIPCHKLFISRKNQEVRLDLTKFLWAEEQWNRVHFSDESIFNLFESGGKRFVRSKNEEHLSPQRVKKTVKFGRGRNNVGDDFFRVCWRHCSLHGIINASVYKELLRQHALPHLRKRTVETPIYMQGNAPYHKAKTLNICYEVAIINPRYESYRECMENHWSESSEKKSSKY